MRVVKDQKDIQAAFNELFDWKDKLTAKSWDFHGLRITNASPSIDEHDYVTRGELSKTQQQALVTNKHYAIIWSKAGTVATGQVIPCYNVTRDRVGKPVDVWARIASIGGVAPSVALTLNIYVNGTFLLTSDLTIPIGSKGPVHSSQFVSPLPSLGLDVEIIASITGGDATNLSIGLVVEEQ